MPLPHRLCLAFGALLALALLPRTVLADESALAAIVADNAEVQTLTQAAPKAGTPAATAQEKALKDLAARVLDLPAMAQQSLGKHWAELTPAQQKSFSETFQELVEDNYVNQIRFSSGYAIHYGKSTTKDGDTSVATTVTVTRNGHTDSSDVVYDLRKVGAGWKVEDIVTDDESLIEDYQSEFGQIITRQGFDALAKKLADRVAKLRAEE